MWNTEKISRPYVNGMWTNNQNFEGALQSALIIQVVLGFDQDDHGPHDLALLIVHVAQVVAHPGQEGPALGQVGVPQMGPEIAGAGEEMFHVRRRNPRCSSCRWP